MATSVDRLIVAAIDFGTTYSGLAFSFKYEFVTYPCKVSVKLWNGHQLVDSKAPTCVLIKPDGKTFDAFGFEAEAKYSELSDANDNKQWYFFQRFKLMLENKPIHKDTMLVDECGKRLSALKVFSLAIRYMVDDLTKILTAQVKDNLQDDIHWVLTVPAIWNDSAKDFMSLAAQEAGLSLEKVTIALEPVAASLYCITKLANTPGERFEFRPGNKFLVLDAGDTVDIAVYEVSLSGQLKELYKATGGVCGGALVDQAFISFIEEFTEKETLERYKKEQKEGYIELMRNFAVMKTEISDKQAVRIRLPYSFTQFVKNIKGQTFAQIIQGSRYTKQVKLLRDQFRYDGSIWHSFFEQSIDSIHNFLAAALRQSATYCVETILMVGGFSESPILQKEIKEKFPRMKVIVPPDAGLAVLKGAVIFGYNPIEVSSLQDSPMAFASDLHASRSKDLGQSGDQQTSNPHLRLSSSSMPTNREPMKPDEIVRQGRLPSTGDELNRLLSKSGDQQTSKPHLRPSSSSMPKDRVPMTPDEIVRQGRLTRTGDEFKRVLSKTGDQQTSKPHLRTSSSSMPTNREPMKPDEIVRQGRLPSTGDELNRLLSKRDDQQTSEQQRPSWCAMPSYWEPMKPDEFVRKVRLPNTGDEFIQVLSNFIQTLDNREILTIHRIQSTFLWEHYCVKKKEMEKNNGTDGANEKIIFHGTKPDIIESICAENLDIRLAGTNAGAILGHGTYFATDAKMSDCYATPDPSSGRRYMLQCRVLVGRWAKGKKGLRRPPEITESAADGYRRRYNSCVDNVLNPRIFCIFDHVQYYPEYVIEYE